TMANPFYAELVGREPEELIGKPMLEAIPEIRSQGFDILLRDVIKTGIPYIAKAVAVDIFRNNRLETIYVDLAYMPRKEQEKITGVLVVATDITEQILSRKKIEESETRFRSLINEAPVGTCLYVGPDFRVEVANDIIMGYWGKGKEVLGKPMLEVMPELKGQPFPDIIRKVYTSGKTYEEKAAKADLVVDGVLSTFYFDFTYKPLFNENHEVYAVLDMAVDVTQQVMARKELEASETKLRGIISSAPAGIGLFVGRDLIVENPNQTFIDIVGKGPDIVGKPLREVMPELLTEGQPFLQILDDVFTSGVMFQSPGSLVKIVQQGVMTYRYYNITYSPLFDTDGNVYAILDIAVDVTDQINAQKKLEQAEASLLEAIELAELGTWSLDVPTGEASFSNRLMDWFGLEPSQAKRTAVPGIHQDDSERVYAEIAKALRPGSDGLLDTEYIVVNPRTGQHRIIHMQGKTVFDDQGNPLK
ncbi:MAG: PAS domain S-box protein, partial [Sphingobacteriales bacterium]